MGHIGRLTVLAGAALSAVGLVVGFGALYLDADGLAVSLLGLVPFGFVLLLTGTVISQLHRPR